MKRHVLIAMVLSCMSHVVAKAAEPEKPTLSVARITSSIAEGQRWGWATPRTFLPCYHRQGVELFWGTGSGRLNLQALEQPIRVELKKQGFAVAGDTSDPFAERRAGDFALGATITSLDGGYCIGTQNHTEGFTSLEIDWQIYSTRERRVIAKVHTAGNYKTASPILGGFEAVMYQALDDNLKKLTESPEFQQALNSPQPITATAAVASPATQLVLAGSKAAGPAKISDAVGSVVLVLSGGGHGSGFLVSSDGYLLTAEHVVGSDKYVKIRWSDGLEGVGEVVRANKRRDVALIKVDPRGRQPLALHRAAPDPGDTVFAIGAPLDIKNQSTVTRGVASANRILDGFSFIQSDVTISPGNSGGPLLDEKGQVLGICDLTFRPAGADVPTGINYFVPIDDALRFLSAEPK